MKKFDLTSVLIPVISFLSPIWLIMLAVGAFILLDTIVGIWRSKKLGIKLTSKKFNTIWNKMFIYQSVIITFFFLDQAIMNQIVLMFFSVDFLLTKILALILISSEFYSIDESYKQATGTGLLELLKKNIKIGKDIKKDIKN